MRDGWQAIGVGRRYKASVVDDRCRLPKIDASDGGGQGCFSMAFMFRTSPASQSAQSPSEPAPAPHHHLQFYTKRPCAASDPRQAQGWAPPPSAIRPILLPSTWPSKNNPCMQGCHHISITGTSSHLAHFAPTALPQNLSIDSAHRLDKPKEKNREN